MNNTYGLTFISWLVKSLKMATFWKDGDTFSFHWNYWNPLTIVGLPFFILPVIIFAGVVELREYHYHYGFGYSKYWKKRLDKREFI